MAAGTALAAVGGAALLRRRNVIPAKLQSAVPSLAARLRPDRNGGGGAAPADADQASRRRQPWRCECGQALLVSGQGRHQIYWLEDTDETDPVLSDRCPSCDRLLPAVSRTNAEGCRASRAARTVRSRTEGHLRPGKLVT